MIVKVEGLRKKLSGKIVLNEVSFFVNEGEIFALIGPNGAGKTTTLRCIYGDLLPDSGVVEVFGENPASKVKERIAVVGEDRRAFKRFTGDDYTKFWRMLYPGWDDRIFSRFALHYSFDMKQRVETYSIGMRTLFFLSLAFSSGADLFVLDEPTQHLDPEIREDVLRMIRSVSGSGKTILISSHEIYEIEEIATSFAIIKEGKILYSAEVDQAKEEHRVISREEKVPEGKVIGLLSDGILVRTSENIGRYPTLKEIALGYLKGKEEFSPFSEL